MKEAREGKKGTGFFSRTTKVRASGAAISTDSAGARPAAQFGHDEGWDQSFVQEDIGLAGGVEVEGGAGAGDGEGVDPVEANPIARVVMRVLFQGDPVVDPPGLQAVGTAAHPVLRPGPAVAIFFHGGPVDGKIGGEGGEGGKEGDGIFQADHQGAGIGGGNFHGFRGSAAGLEIFRPADEEKNFGVGLS